MLVLGTREEVVVELALNPTKLEVGILADEPAALVMLVLGTGVEEITAELVLNVRLEVRAPANVLVALAVNE